MDFANLKEQVSNLTLYDLKAGVRKVQNGTPPAVNPQRTQAFSMALVRLP